MKTHHLLLTSILVLFGCAGTVSVLGTPTVLSETPYDVAPEVNNLDEVGRAMHREYPPLLRDARIRGSVVLRLYLDEIGQVQQTSLDQGSGHRALDDMALKVAQVIKFNPAQNRGEAVPVLLRVTMDLVPPPARPAIRREIRRGN